ncbi:hypothetical protein [Tropicimonas sp. IMCC34043]|uniref:hypothetical protein n=1 Tax=Tropicimonas sp. IMCC34043 TaxID=2248760 RepID=UPI000E2832CA|nr:hypothetical protein [Tropicimonas sp. IMCC34043]
MTITSISDLASNLLLRSNSSRLRGDLSRLVGELSSGRVAARETAVDGSFRAVSAIQQSISRLDAFKISATEAAGFAGAVQDSLGAIHDLTSDLSTAFIAAGGAGTITQASALAEEARQDFTFITNKLNTQYAGRSLFAGATTDRAAVIDGADILNAVKTAVSGATTAAGVAAAVDAWFAPGADFDTIAYLGSDKPLASMQVGSDRSVALQVTAADDEFREMLKGATLAVLVNDGPLVGNAAEQMDLARLAGKTLIAGNEALLDLRASVGLVEERIEAASVANASESSAMTTALLAFVTKDEFDGASELRQIESQIEILYTLTARTSALRLTDYL